MCVSLCQRGNQVSALTATEAKNRFGQLLEMAQAEAVEIQKDGRTVAVVVSADEYRRLRDQRGTGPNPLVMQAHARSIKRWGKVYEALAR